MNVLEIGRRGLGKSTHALAVALKLNPHVIIFDTNSQYRSADRVTSSLRELEDEIEAHDDLGEQYIIAYVPQGDVEEEWDAFAELLWEYGNYSVIVDEAHRLQKPSYVNHNLDRLMRQAPRRERGDDDPIDLIQTFHRPVDINGIVLGLADVVYMFRMTRARDVEAVEREFGPEAASRVTQLLTPASDPPGREVLEVNIERDEIFVLTDPDKWFINIRKSRVEPGGFAHAT